VGARRAACAPTPTAGSSAHDLDLAPPTRITRA
jgi:hypothetical protein